MTPPQMMQPSMIKTAGTGRIRIGEISLTYETVPGIRPASGEGRLPFIFQHGMGGDTLQPLDYVGNNAPTPVVVLSARGHSRRAAIWLRTQRPSSPSPTT